MAATSTENGNASNSPMFGTFKSILNVKTSLIQTCHLLLHSNLGLSNELKLTIIIIRENIYHATRFYHFRRYSLDQPVKLPDGSTINGHTPTTLEYAASIVDQIDVATDHVLLKTPLIYTDINGNHMRRFHVPIKLSDVLTDKRKMYLDTDWEGLLCRNVSNRTSLNQLTTISDLHEKLVDGVYNSYDENLDIFELKYVRDKKHQNRKTLLAAPDTKFSNGVCLQRHLRELLGRLRTTLIPSMHAEARIIGKIGLLQYADEETWNRDPDTAAVVLCMVAEASDARAFTLDSANRSSFSEAIHLLLQYLGQRSNTHWGLLACIYPVHIKDSSGEHIDWIFRTCLKLLRQFSYVLNYLWNSGVKECAAKNMLIPRRTSSKCSDIGSTNTVINSSAWNAIADAWNNILRFIRTVNHVLLKPQIPAYKTMRLMAGDLTQWASVELKCLEKMGDGYRSVTQQEKYLHLKNNKVDADVFAELTSNGLTPWSIVNTRYSDIADFYYGEQAEEFFKVVTAACNKHDFPIARYLGNNNPISKCPFRPHKTMICGIEIIPANCVDLVDVSTADGVKSSAEPAIDTHNVDVKTSQVDICTDINVDAKITKAGADNTYTVDIYGNPLELDGTNLHNTKLDTTLTKSIIYTLKSLGFAGAKSWTGK
jgi:hypothetical protein